jgi:hypothetical protein
MCLGVETDSWDSSCSVIATLEYNLDVEILSCLDAACTERAVQHGSNKSFDEVQFPNFRAEMSSKTISFHQPSQLSYIPAATLMA